MSVGFFPFPKLQCVGRLCCCHFLLQGAVGVEWEEKAGLQAACRNFNHANYSRDLNWLDFINWIDVTVWLETGKWKRSECSPSSYPEPTFAALRSIRHNRWRFHGVSKPLKDKNSKLLSSDLSQGCFLNATYQICIAQWMSRSLFILQNQRCLYSSEVAGKLGCIEDLPSQWFCM